MSLPKFLYHATAQCVEDKIKVEGLLGHPMSGGVYLSTSPEDCCSFMSMRLLAHVHGAKEVEFKGEMHVFPDVVMHDYIAVFKVDTALLDPDLLEVGTDHSSLLTDAASYLYRGDIPVEALDAYVAHMAPAEA